MTLNIPQISALHDLAKRGDTGTTYMNGRGMAKSLLARKLIVYERDDSGRRGVFKISNTGKQLLKDLCLDGTSIVPRDLFFLMRAAQEKGAIESGTFLYTGIGQMHTGWQFAKIGLVTSEDFKWDGHGFTRFIITDKGREVLKVMS